MSVGNSLPRLLGLVPPHAEAQLATADVDIFVVVLDQLPGVLAGLIHDEGGQSFSRRFRV